jgi:hypothetical protein
VVRAPQSRRWRHRTTAALLDHNSGYFASSSPAGCDSGHGSTRRLVSRPRVSGTGSTAGRRPSPDSVGGDHLIPAMTDRPATTKDEAMAIPGGPSRGRRVGSPRVRSTDLVDMALSSYIEWRTDADAAICAYRRWIDAPPPEREQRFSAYTAALDQEEAAATAYARSIANFAL